MDESEIQWKLIKLMKYEKEGGEMSEGDHKVQASGYQVDKSW